MTEPTAIWLDMQLPPSICGWLSSICTLDCLHFSELEMERTSDEEAFERAREANALVLTKDFDFAKIVQRRGPPPAVLWLRCGNCSTAVLRTLLEEIINPALDLARSGEPLVEIAD